MSQRRQVWRRDAQQYYIAKRLSRQTTKKANLFIIESWFVKNES